MNNKKTSNPVRMIAFFLAAVILICTFGFTVDGWQFKDDDFSSGRIKMGVLNSGEVEQIEQEVYNR